MSDPEQQIVESPGTVWDAPNQQTVRPDESPPWEEGTGGVAGEPKEPAEEPEPDQDAPESPQEAPEPPPPPSPAPPPSQDEEPF
jgi:hypothetical protein